MKRSIVIALAVAGCALSLTACDLVEYPQETSGAQVQQSEPAPEQQSKPVPDPKTSWVRVWERDAVTKRCDETTMIYRDAGIHERSITAVPLHPECME